MSFAYEHFFIVLHLSRLSMDVLEGMPMLGYFVLFFYFCCSCRTHSMDQKFSGSLDFMVTLNSSF
jgi:hypothetical protein